MLRTVAGRASDKCDGTDTETDSTVQSLSQSIFLVIFSLVIAAPLADLRSSIDLLRQDQPSHLVRERQAAQAHERSADKVNCKRLMWKD